MPKVSVIIPVYNVEKYLRQALDSVVNQTLSDIEIICVDDCSTDNSLQILKEYAHKDNRIKIIEQKENQGPGVARDIALDIAIGEYIMFLDPDDWYELNACELSYNQILKNKNDMVLFFYLRTNDQTGSITKSNREKLYTKFLSVQNLDINNVEKFEINDFSAWGQVYKKEFLNKYEIRFGQCRNFEDQLFMGKAYIYSNNISILNAYLYNYRVRDNSLTFAMPKGYKDLFIVSFNLFDILININYSKNLMGNIMTHRLKSIFYWQNFYSNFGIKIKFDYYKRMRKFFIYVNKNININDYKNYIGLKNYNKFEKILDEYTFYYSVKTISQNILSIRNEYRKGTKHKVTTILGIKIKIKCKDMPETLVAVERERERERVIRLTAYRKDRLAKVA